MNTSIAKASTLVAILGLSTAMLLTGCGGQASNTVATANDSAKVAEQAKAETAKEVPGVAAKVFDRSITEQQVSDYVAQYRTYASLTDDADWATFIDQNGTSAEAIRTDAINFFVTRYAVDAKAEELGIAVSDEEVAEAVKANRESYGYEGDASWEAFLASAAYDDASYADDVRYSLLENKIADKEVPYSEPSDSQLMVQGNANTESYTGKYVRIARYNSGEGKVASSTCAGMMERGNVVSIEDFLSIVGADVDNGFASEIEEGIWTCLTTPSGSAAAAIEGLSVGQAAYYVDDDGTPSIVFVEKQYTTKKNGRLDLTVMPDAIKAKLTRDTVKSLRQSDINDYLAKLAANANPTVNHMPAGLPYDVDMSLSTYGAADNTVSDEEMAQTTQNQVSELERIGAEQKNANGSEQ